MKVWTLLCLYIFCYELGSTCVIPPLKCPNKNITFWLYTRANAKNPVELKIGNSQSISYAPWVKGAPIKMLLHGYTGHREFAPNTQIRPAYMECCNYNIISVDYHNVVLEPCYMESVENSDLVGMCIAQFIDELVQVYDFPLSSFHVIGFSLGGQVAGYIANHLKSGKLSRISALDPALPLFVTTDNRKKIDSEDAHFVDVLHTNALEKGKLEASGHVDYFANGGLNQPGCKATENQTKSGCNHERAPIYYAESITTTKGFFATKCYSWTAYMLGWCALLNSDEEILVGENAPKNASGAYFFNTNSEYPFARGSRRKIYGKKKQCTRN